MKAIVYHGNKDIRYTDSHPSPNITHETEVKIKVDFCGICGSDLHEYLDGPIFFKAKRVKFRISARCSVWVMRLVERW